MVQSSEGSSVTFTASDSETISIPTAERHSPNDESVTVTVSTGTGYTVGTPPSASTVITRKRIPPATPEPPTVTGLTTTSVRAEWAAPSSELPITGYSVRHRPVAGSEWSEQHTGSSKTNLTIDGLTVNTIQSTSCR